MARLGENRQKQKRHGYQCEERPDLGPGEILEPAVQRLLEGEEQRHGNRTGAGDFRISQTA